jgi:ABC-type cobalamin/Fe3+-siderophores transport system ATPase subunit
MLASFLIKNFRLFKELQIQELGRVNLVVGRNNSGKSALLEAIELYASNTSPKILADLITKRQETWTNQTQAPGQKTDLNPLRHLFYGHQLPALGECGIVVGPMQPVDEQVKLQVGAYRLQEEAGTIRRVPVTEITTFEDLPDFELSLIAIENGKSRRVLRLDRNPVQEARSYQRTANLISSEPKAVLQVVPTRNMTEEKLADLWDSINLTGLDEEVIAGLQLLERNIVGIAFVGDRTSRDGRLPLVKMNNIAEPLPLKSMGDGILRLFHITVALVNARDGILLIDEFENGLHWSVQPKVWEMVFRLAEKLNVQVFASTHSRDCIRGFESVWQKYENLGCFFRLNSGVDRPTTVTVYTNETLSDALETDVEVR